MAKAIVEAPPHYLRDGGVIAVGYDAELDELRLLGTNTEQFLLEPPCPNDQAKRP